jgi:hypothetical protein
MMIDTVRAIDEIFIVMAESDVDTDDLDAAVEALWTALEMGYLRLVVDGERLRVDLFEGPATERQTLAERNWPIAAARKRVLCGLYEDKDPARLRLP